MNKKKILKVLSCSLLISTALGMASCKKGGNSDVTTPVESSPYVSEDEQVFKNVTYSDTKVTIKITDEKGLLEKCFFYGTSSKDNQEKSTEMTKTESGFVYEIEKPEYNDDAYNLTNCHVIYLLSGSSEQHNLSVENIEITSATGKNKADIDNPVEKAYIDVSLFADKILDEDGNYTYKIIAEGEDENLYNFTGDLFINGVSAGKINENQTIDINNKNFHTGSNLITISNFELTSDTKKTGKTQSVTITLDYEDKIDCEISSDKTVVYTTEETLYIDIAFKYDENVPLKPDKILMNEFWYTLKDTKTEDNETRATIEIPITSLKQGANELKFNKVTFENGYEIDLDNQTLNIEVANINLEITSNLEKYVKRSDLESGVITINFTVQNIDGLNITGITVNNKRYDLNKNETIFDLTYRFNDFDKNATEIKCNVQSLNYKIDGKEYTYDVNLSLNLAVYDLNTNYVINDGLDYKNGENCVIVDFEDNEYTDIKPYRLIISNGRYEKEYTENYVYEDGHIYFPIETNGKQHEWITVDKYDNYQLGFNGFDFYIGDEKVVNENSGNGLIAHFRIPKNNVGENNDINSYFSYVMPAFAIDHYKYILTVDGFKTIETDDTSSIYLVLKYNECPFDENNLNASVEIKEGNTQKNVDGVITIVNDHIAYFKADYNLKSNYIYSITQFISYFKDQSNFECSYDLFDNASAVEEFTVDDTHQSENPNEYVPPIGSSSYDTYITGLVNEKLEIPTKDTSSDNSNENHGTSSSESEGYNDGNNSTSESHGSSEGTNEEN